MALTAERKAELERRIRAGETKKALIADGFAPSTVYLARVRLGKSPRHKLPDELRLEARRLRIEENLSTPAIAHRLEISNFAVYSFVRDLGPWARPHKYQHHPQEWTDADVAALTTLWPQADETTIRAALPARQWTAISRKACSLGIIRTAHRRYGDHLPRHIRELRAAREDQKLTRPQLARVLDVHPQFLTNWELGKSHPVSGNLLKWCAALGLELTVVAKDG